MIKIATIVGARPQIIKAAAISRVIREDFPDQITELISHTGQHYDANMSDTFFTEMDIPEPAYNLGSGSGGHGSQTAKMLAGLEAILEKEMPDFVIIYGDTNSTLAGALAASKLNIPVAHVESGMRSFNKSMPEEINRIVADHCSTLLFTPTLTGIRNLEAEGISVNNTPPFTADNPAVFHCGDVMYDNCLYYGKQENEGVVTGRFKEFLNELGFDPGERGYILLTVHRNINTDDPGRLTSLLRGALKAAESTGLDIIFPVHPRTAKALEKLTDPSLISKILEDKHILLIPPASYFEMLYLEKHCRMVITDSGGVQKEAYFFKKPVIILRKETEWEEIVEQGTAMLTDADEDRIADACRYFYSKNDLSFPQIFGDGRSARFICNEILNAVL